VTHAFVVVVDGHGEHLLGPFLAHYVRAESLVDLHRRGKILEHETDLFLDDLVLDDIGAQLDALVADLVLALSTERAAQMVAVFLAHRLAALLLGLGVRLLIGDQAMGDHAIDQPVGHRLFGGHDVVAVGVRVDLLHRLSRVFGEDLIELPARAQHLPGADLDVGRLSLHAAERLVDEDPAVG
jgi:hypothetical protein